MEIEYGAEVVDKSGKVLGTIDHIIRDTWTGEIRKFMIRKKLLDKYLLFSFFVVFEVSKSKIKVKISFDEQG
jgi:sporulation protein YlmC with PRC-barrel domain